MANTTNYNWETPDDTDLVKDGAAAIRTLGSSIDTTTKNLNPETTTGDIAYRSATANTNTRLAIGSTGQVLTVAAGVPSWAAASGGLTLIKTQTIGTTVSSIAVTSVFSSTYDNYLILITGGVMSASRNFQLQLGSTTSGYYESTYYFGPTSGTINSDPGNGVANFRYAGTGSTDGFSGIVYLQGPNIAKPTFYKSDNMRAVSNRTYSFSLGTEDSGTQHTGFTLLVDGSGTATGGAIKVYGYQN